MRSGLKRFFSVCVMAFALSLMLSIGAYAHTFDVDDYNGTEGKATLTISNVNENDIFQAWCIVVIGYDAESNALTYGFTPAAKEYFDSKHVTIDDFMKLTDNSIELNELLAGLPEAIRTNTSGKWIAPWGGENLTATDGTITVMNCKAGGYFIQPIASTSVYSPMFTAIVPEVKNGHYEYGDVEISAKHSEVSISKKVKLNSNAASYGDSVIASDKTVDAYSGNSEVKYQIVMDVPKYLSDGAVHTTMKVEDTLPAGITLKNGTIVVYGVNSDTDEGTLLTDETNYELLSESNSISIDFTNTYDSVSGYEKIRIEYICEVNTGVAIGAANRNTAQYTYSCYPYVDDAATEKTISDSADVWSYGMQLIKYDFASADVKLADAEFELYRPADQTESNTQKITFNGAEKTVVRIADQLDIKTDANGAFSISGIKEGTYYLIEKKAPSGYQLDREPIAVNITGVATDKTDGYQIVRIANHKASLTLPTTGNRGMVVFTLIGLVGMTVAIILLLVTGRKRNGMK